jgi:hypothetical protein
LWKGARKLAVGLLKNLRFKLEEAYRNFGFLNKRKCKRRTHLANFK